ncbi:MAG TPA: VWA-like domain-containing protein [Acidimicrobiales bacterium]|nr:VWA-like domain-containing protein [Acidimicrobiales bacterium]
MTEQLDARTLAASRLWAAHKFPYLASALFATRVVPKPGIGGAAVDEQWRLYVDPAVASDWSVEQMGSLIVHHVGHLVREHAERARAMGIDPSTADAWTRACDAELNDDLAEAGITPPGHAVLPEELGGVRGRMAEEYFALAAAAPPDGEPDDHGSGTHGQSRDWDDDSDGDGGQGERNDRGLDQHEAQLVRRRVAEAVQQAVRERGDVPGGWRRWAGELLHPRVDWRRALAAEIRRSIQRHAGRVDYSYRRPSRRASVSPDVVLPAMERPVPEVAIVVDTSASMGDDLLERVLGEIDGLLDAIGVRTAGVPVLAVDTEVHAMSRVHSARQVVLAGGGGTDMSRGLAAATALRPKPSVVVVLTDGYTPWPAFAPKATSVVVALVESPGRSWPTPDWARVVVIDDAA